MNTLGAWCDLYDQLFSCFGEQAGNQKIKYKPNYAEDFHFKQWSIAQLGNQYPGENRD